MLLFLTPGTSFPALFAKPESFEANKGRTCLFLLSKQMKMRGSCLQTASLSSFSFQLTNLSRTLTCCTWISVYPWDWSFRLKFLNNRKKERERESDPLSLDFGPSSLSFIIAFKSRRRHSFKTLHQGFQETRRDFALSFDAVSFMCLQLKRRTVRDMTSTPLFGLSCKTAWNAVSFVCHPHSFVTVFVIVVLLSWIKSSWERQRNAYPTWFLVCSRRRRDTSKCREDDCITKIRKTQGNEGRKKESYERQKEIQRNIVHQMTLTRSDVEGNQRRMKGEVGGGQERHSWKWGRKMWEKRQ